MVEVFNAGKFFSRGRGSHPVRIIDSDELIFVLQGELAISEEDRFYLLKPNDYLLLHRGRKHGGWMPYPKNLRYIWLHFRADEAFWQQQPDSGHLLRGDRIVGYLQDFLLEQSLSDADPVNLQLLFQLIFRELRRSIRKGENAETTPLAAAAERYLRLHCTEPIHIGSISGTLHCNARYLGQLYRRTFGETLTAALNRFRVEHAAKLLSSEDMTIKEAAFASGFNDMAYFRRQFRKIYNQSPGDYRKYQTQEHRNTL